MAEWLSEALARVLNTDSSDEISSYIMSIETIIEFDDFMHTLLDVSRTEHKIVYDNAKAIKFGVQTYKPENESAERAELRRLLNCDFKKEILNTPSISRAPPEDLEVHLKDSQQEEVFLLSNVEESVEPRKKAKITKKYVQYHINQLQQTTVREGRIPCQCQAQIHELINNCLNCGRIVCEQEGSGPCFFCGQLVCTDEEEEMMKSNTKHGEYLERTLKSRKISQALELRDRLLGYDKNCGQLTKVIDDEHDYFDVNSRWLTSKEKEEKIKAFEKFHDSKHGSKLRPKKITLDFVTNKVIEENEEEYVFEESVSNNFEEDTSEAAAEMNKTIKKMTDILLGDNSVAKAPDNPTVKVKEFDIITSDGFKFSSVGLSPEVILDKKLCLTMHQPWASLLIAGIKKHEGRTWFSDVRGKLWIHAASKKPEPEEIKSVEDFYKDYYQNSKIKFPKSYPTSVLLGSVMLDEVLDSEEYNEMYPNGESNSPFVFICSEPEVLPLPIAMKGSSKIYKLEQAIYDKAKKAMIYDHVDE